MSPSIRRLFDQVAAALLIFATGLLPAPAAAADPVPNDCAVYPIALPDSVVSTLSPGDIVAELPRGTGPGNYSWLSWTGANDSPTLAASLTVPGDSGNWFNPDQPADRSIDAGDFIQGGPGSMNSSAVRAAMDILLTRDIVLPVFDATRARGSRLDYRVERFATVRLRDYRLTGNGWIGFRYLGEADCYNDAPVAQAQALSTEENTPLAIELEASDADGDALEFRVLEAPAHGTLTGTGSTLTYTPAADYHGPDQFRFVARDALADSAPALVSIEVIDGNEPPVAHPQSLRMDEDTSLPIVLTAEDADGDTLAFEIVQGPATGELTGTPPTLSYTPPPQWNGTVSFTFLVSDAESQSPAATVEIVVDPVNDAPLALPQSAETPEDTPLALQLQGTDPDGDTLAFEIVAGPEHGTLSGNGSDVVYQPADGYHGGDGFVFSVTDAAGATRQANVELQVLPVNDPPRIVSLPVLEARQLTPYTYAAQAVDPDVGDVLAWSLAAAPQGMTIDASTGAIAWTPRADQSGTHAVVLRVADQAGAADQQAYEITLQQRDNAGPQIVSQPVELAVEGTPYRYDADAVDPDGDALVYTLSQAPADMTIGADDGVIDWPAPSELSRGHVDAHALCDVAIFGESTGERVVDMVTVVDRSGSMDTEHAWIGQMIGTLDLALRVNGVGTGGGNRYGLVDYDRAPRPFDLGGSLFAAYPAFIDGALRLKIDGSGDEDGLLAAHYAVTQYPMRAQAARNVLLITDEGNSWHPGSPTRDAVLQALQQHDVMLNAALNVGLECADGRRAIGLGQNQIGYVADGQGGYSLCSGAIAVWGDANTLVEYKPLALDSGGAVWDLNALRDGGNLAKSFTRALIDVKVKEIQAQTRLEPRADIAIVAIAAGSGDPQARVTLVNRGKTPSAAGTLELLGEGAQSLGTQPLPTLLPGQQTTIAFALADAAASTTGLRARATLPDGTQCDSGNDTLLAPWVRLAATDPFGLSDEQAYAVTVAEADSAPRIVSTPVTTAQIGYPYRYAVHAVDDDRGDALLYRLLQAPAGAAIDERTGVMTYKPTTAAGGTQHVRITATDLAGHVAEQNFDLAIQAGAPLPRITSEAVPRAVQGTLWAYAPTGENLAGLQFQLVNGPTGMTIDAATGALAWNVPATLPKATRLIAIIAGLRNDGAYDTQSFEIFVDIPNAAPRITSTPAMRSQVRNNFSYPISVSDDNVNETFAWTLSKAPPYMTLDAGGYLDWPYPVATTDFPETLAIQDPYCREPLSTGISLGLREQWRWTGGSGMGMPVVAHLFDGDADGDVDADDDVSLAVAGTFAGLRGLAAFDARSGQQRWKYTQRTIDESIAPVAVDLDGDGRDEIVAATSDQGIVAINADGSQRWVGPVLGGFSLYDSSIHAGDIDADGTPEILFGALVVNADGTPRWKVPGSDQYRNRASLVMTDIEGDGVSELLFHDRLLNAQGATLQQFILPANAQFVRWSPGNLDADPALELAAVVNDNSATRLLAYQPDGTPLFAPVTLSRETQALVADFDNDGGNEIFVVQDVALIEADGSLSYAAPGGSLGGAAFAADLDGDGSLELVRSAGGWIFLSAGPASAVFTGTPDDQPSASAQGATLVEIDDEGWIVAGGGENLRAWRASSGRWLPPALTANQREMQPATHPQLRGTHGQLGTRGTLSRTQSDVWIGNLRLTKNASGTSLSVDVRNRGLASTAAPLELRVNSGGAAGTLLHQATLAPLAAGALRTVSFAVPDTDVLHDQIFATVAGSTALDDCETRNHATSARYVELRVTDHGGLFDEQRFVLQMFHDNTWLAFASTPVYTATELSPYSYDVQVTDPDIGDRAAFSLVSAPAGARIDRATGLVTWTPARGQKGTHSFVVEATDLPGPRRQQGFSVTVAEAPNTAPRFTSTPLTTARDGRVYSHTVAAVDDQGDPIVFTLSQAPEGMHIGAANGVITWAANTVGEYAVKVKASDDHGGSSEQAFTLQVVADPAPEVGREGLDPLARVGETYAQQIAANDPQGDALEYALIDPPAGASIDENGLLQWTPGADQLGPQSITVQVSDGVNTVTLTWPVRVVAADAPPQIVILIEPTVPSPSDPVTLTVHSEIAGTLDVRLDNAPLALEPEGSVTVPPLAIGPHVVSVTVQGPDGPVVEVLDFVVADPAGGAPVVSLASLEDGQQITAPVQVAGSVIDTDLARWELGFQDRNGGAIVVLASGTQAFTERDLARFDPTRLLNGQYHVVLQGWDAAGNHGFDARVVRVTGDLKLGHYSITFEEATVPVAGIPVTVTRTYDTRRRLEDLDFGHGWTVDANNVRVHESRRIGFGWQMHRLEEGHLDRYCLLSNGDPIVTVTLPDGQVESFRAVAVPECGVTPRVDVTVGFQPIDGTDSTLTSRSYGTVRFTGSNLVDLSDPALQPIDPSGYVLTTAEGVSYEIEQFEGLKKVSEPNGAYLTYNADGVRHSSGVGIDFIRDAQGRIERMVLPDGTHRDYAYSPAGDLIGLTDTANETAAFGYHARFAHYLETIEDARGIVVSRNEYDDDGKLKAVIDAHGHRIEYTSDVDARTATVKNRRGHATLYVYNDRGDVLSETNALDETTTHTYDVDGNELTRTDDLGRTTTWTFDARGNVLTETNDLGETTTSTWNAQNQLLTQKDASGALVLQNEYIDHGLNLHRTLDALGHATGFRYDLGPGSSNTGNVDAITDAAGHTTAMAYAAFSTFQISETDALGRVTTMVHDDLGRRTEERRTRTLPSGASQELATTFAYDDKGRLLSTLHPDGSETTATYDGLDQPAQECDALQRCTTHVYDDRGLETETHYADGTQEFKTYDPNGNLATQTDRNGETTRFVYDAADRLVETVHPDETPATDADNPRSFNVYDGAGQLIESRDETGHATTYGYDDAGRRTTVTDALDRVTTTAYDTRGRRVAVTDPAGRTTRFVHDDAGRLIETVHPDAADDDGDDTNNPRTRTEYDALGRKTAEIDEAGRTTRYAYDQLGRLVAVVLPDPVTGDNPPLVNGDSPSSTTLVTRYGYDEVGNKTTQTDAEGRVTRWDYDAMGRETARVLPEGQRETRTYNAAGELESHTDFNGRTTRYTYDLAGRVDTIDYPQDADVGFGYNARGERTSATDGRGPSTTDVDARSRTVKVTDADGGIIEYEYDAAGNLLARISPSQSLVYTYDDAHRLDTVTRTVDGEAPTVTTYQYDDAGNRSVMLGGDGTRTEYGYDRRNRLTRLTKQTAAGALLVAMSYGVDATGMRTAIEETDPAGVTRTVAYSYDGVKRLTRETIDHREAAHDRTTAWTYDRVGNRLTQDLTTPAGSETTSYAYDDNDRLLTETNSVSGLTTYGYDDNGNTRSKTTATEATTYAYDDANRLIEAITPVSTMSYVYNADGLRVRQTVTPTSGAPTTTWYLQDSGYAYAQVIEEWQAEGSAASRLTATYTFADDLVSQTRYAADGTPTTHFIQADGFGSTRWLTDGSGAITDSIDYDAFGNEIRRNGNADVEHLYRGERYDASAETYDLRARLYSPALGRFLTQDSFGGFGGEPRSLHKYTYTHDDPVNGIDPSGHMNMQELSLGMQIAVRNLVSTVARYGTRFVSRAKNAMLRTAQGAQQRIKACIRKPEKCDLDTPLLIEGNDTPETSQHVRDAQFGIGSNIIPSGVLFNRIAPAHSRAWLRSTVECNPAQRSVYAGANGQRGACDEFPYASAKQGGRHNHPLRVSLRLTPSVETGRQGARLSAFYRLCGVQANHPKKSQFLVVGMPEVPSWVLPPPLSCFKE